jgi:hypothetical protein
MTWKVRPRASLWVINYYPQYPNDPNSPDYCQVKLMLYHPFTVDTDLLTVDGQAYGSYVDAFWAYHHSHTYPEDFYTDPDGSASDTESEEDEDKEMDIDYPLADFEAFARCQPQEDFTRVDPLEGLGTREVDHSYDWSTHVGQYDLMPNVWDQVKAENPITQAITMDPSPLPLNPEQRKLYDTIVFQYTRKLAFKNTSQLLLNINGVAGSGKTFTLLKICA